MQNVLRCDNPRSAKNIHALANLSSFEFIVNLVEIIEINQVPYVCKKVISSQKLKKIIIVNVFRHSFLRSLSKMLIRCLHDVKPVNSYLVHGMSEINTFFVLWSSGI